MNNLPSTALRCGWLAAAALVIGPSPSSGQARATVSGGAMSAYERDGWTARVAIEAPVLTLGVARLEVGGELWFAKTKVGYVAGARRRLVGIGPVATVSFGSSTGRVIPYVRAVAHVVESDLIDYFFLIEDDEDRSPENLGLADRRGLAFGGEVGARLAIARRVHFELSAGALWPDLYQDGNPAITRYQFGIGTSF